MTTINAESIAALDLDAIEGRQSKVEMDLPELAARTLIESDVPALIAEIRRQRAENAELRKQRDDLVRTLETRAEREKEMLAEVAKENDELRELLVQAQEYIGNKNIRLVEQITGRIEN